MMATIAESVSGLVEPLAVVSKVMVATDCSETADRAVRWAAALAESCAAELLLVQVICPDGSLADAGLAVATRVDLAQRELAVYAR